LENASKALLMAGGVLIGILVLSLGVILYATFRDSASFAEKRIEADRINQFNSQFSIYDGKEDLDIYDVIKIASTAKECNKRYGFTSGQEASDDSLYVQVDAKLSSGVSFSNLEEELGNKNDWLVSYSNIEYKCAVEYSNETGRINLIKIEPK